MNEEIKSRRRDQGSGSRAPSSPVAEADLQAQLGQAKSAITDAAHEIGDQAKEAAQTARDKAEELAEQGKTVGAGQMEGFARVARGAADDLEQQSPEIARFVRQAADGLEQAASSVRSRSMGELVDMFQDMARRQPIALFGSSVLAGFMLSRFVKSRSDREAPRQGPAKGQGQESGTRAGGMRDKLPTMPSTVGEMRS
jgi:hypothetical protein